MNPSRLFLQIALIAGALLMLAPILVAVSVSLSPGNQVFSYPPRLIPNSLHPENYLTLIRDLDFGRYFLNSAVVALLSTASVIVTSAMAGYAFACLRFPGSKVLFLIIVVTVMIPIQVTAIPLYILFREVPFAGGNDWLGRGGTGWLDSYYGLIVPYSATTFGVFLMRQHFQALPRSLIEAARIDGSSELRTFWRIYLPLAKPALAAVGILTFTDVWNTFLWPLIIISSPHMRTLQVGLGTLRGQYFTDWNLLMGGVVIAALPPLAVFLLGHKYFVRGVAMSGLKG